MDRCHLLSNTGFARSACLCDAASGDYHAYSGFSPPMGPPQADCALDTPDLALRLGHRRARVFDALQMVSTRGLTQAILAPRSPRGELNTALPWDARDPIVCITLKSCTWPLVDV